MLVDRRVLKPNTMQPKKEGNLIIKLSFEFSVSIIHFCDNLVDIRKFVLSNQLLRSGTSIGANIREAQNAESKYDFIHKMKIAAKEADETEYWLLLCKRTIPTCNVDNLILECQVLIRILSKIISTSKNKTNA